MIPRFDLGASRRLARRFVIDRGLHAVAGLVDFMPSMKQRMSSCHLIEDIEYARHDGHALCLDVLQPHGDGPHPVLIYFHGGGFAVGSKRTHRALAAAYASQGYLVLNADYRLAPRYPFPAALEDACAAWLWAAEHAADYAGDCARMGLAGESAGANLALAVTMACCTPRAEPYAAPLYQRGIRPAFGLLYCGFLQTSKPERYRRAGVSAIAARIAADAARSYLGAFADHPTTGQALADPLCVVEAMTAPQDLPPLFVAAGLADPVVVDSQRLEAALVRLHSPCVARYYPGETHAFHVMFWRKQAITCWRDSFAFLQKCVPVKA